MSNGNESRFLPSLSGWIAASLTSFPPRNDSECCHREGTARGDPLRGHRRVKNGGRGRIRTDERTKRADLQSASFSHLDTLPAKEG